MIRIVSDPFGPSIYVPTDVFRSEADNLSKDITHPLYKASLVIQQQRNAWLQSALTQINIEYSQLDVNDSDFDESSDKEWEPLPLERENPHLQTTIAAVDEVVEKVQADNGYAANLPEEKGVCG
jgi:hypothetical protein